MQVATALPKTGGTLSGALALTADPTTSLQAATKQYVDGQVATAVPKIGGTLTGALLLAADPASSLQAATKQYVDTRVSRSGRHTDRSAGARRQPDDDAAGSDKGICRYVSSPSVLPKAGGTLTGALTLAADPASSLQAATKQYVDTRVSRAGDTLTGALVLAADPTTTLQAATKGYVDTQVAGALPKAGGTLTGVLTLAADPTLSHAGSHQELRRCTRRSITADQRRHVDRPAVAAIQSRLRTAGGTEAIRR